MKAKKLEMVRGSGNVFRDVGHKDADAARFKAVLAAEIIKALGWEAARTTAGTKRPRLATADEATPPARYSTWRAARCAARWVTRRARPQICKIDSSVAGSRIRKGWSGKCKQGQVVAGTWRSPQSPAMGERPSPAKAFKQQS